MDDYSDYDWSAWDAAADDYMSNRGYSDTTEEVQDWQNVSGGGSMEGWGYSDGVWTDPSGESYNMRYLTPNDQLSLGGILSKLGQQAAQQLVKSFTNPNGSTDWRSVMAAAGGLYGLYQSNQAPEKTGYQGGIPKYEAVREAAPNTFDPNRRPGSGGQRYFSQTQFAAPGEAAATARTAAKEEAAGLEALNRANPAQQRRASPTADAAQKGAESAKVREGTAASKVIETMAPPKFATGGILALAKGGEPRYLGGATDGMADKIPARIDGKQEARLSHGEFVIPADVVGHLGNGNSEAGAQRLYSMMDKIRKARTGTTKQGKQVNPDKFMPV
jgi:hypothetical protein